MKSKNFQTEFKRPIDDEIIDNHKNVACCVSQSYCSYGIYILGIPCIAIIYSSCVTAFL